LHLLVDRIKTIAEQVEEDAGHVLRHHLDWVQRRDGQG
jgi:hypothetical protein